MSRGSSTSKCNFHETCTRFWSLEFRTPWPAMKHLQQHSMSWFCSFFFFLDFIAVIGWSSLSSHHLNLMLSLLGCCTCLVSLCAQLGYFLLKCSLLPLVHASWSVVYGCHVPKDHFCHSTRNKSNKKFLKPLHDCILPFTYSWIRFNNLTWKFRNSNEVGYFCVGLAVSFPPMAIILVE